MQEEAAAAATAGPAAEAALQAAVAAHREMQGEARALQEAGARAIQECQTWATQHASLLAAVRSAPRFACPADPCGDDSCARVPRTGRSSELVGTRRGERASGRLVTRVGASQGRHSGSAGRGLGALRGHLAAHAAAARRRAARRRRRVGCGRRAGAALLPPGRGAGGGRQGHAGSGAGSRGRAAEPGADLLLWRRAEAAGVALPSPSHEAIRRKRVRRRWRPSARRATS